MTRHFDHCPSGSEGDNQIVGLSIPVVSSWLGPGNRTILEVASMVVTSWIVAFLRSVLWPCDLFLIMADTDVLIQLLVIF